MASTLEKRTVYAAGLVQGIALVTFPAASTIFIAPGAYDLSSSHYGAMFVPQVITAVSTSLLGTTLAGRYGYKRVYLAGFGCSALLPLTMSFGQEKLVAVSGAVAGGVIAFYQVGYGVAAFGVGPLHDAGVGLPAIFGWSSVVAIAMGCLSFVVAYRHPSPATLHPRPAPAEV